MIVIKNRSYINLAWIIGLILLPIILFFLPKSQFDHGPTMCVYTLITGSNCLGCGMTRACMRIIHFDFIGAWAFNKFAFFVFPYFAYKYAKFLYQKIVNVE